MIPQAKIQLANEKCWIQPSGYQRWRGVIMNSYKREFIDLAIAREALCFGEFTLKSGRVSPYFFNAGEFNTGAALSVLGRCYAAAIVKSDIRFDLLFGPAYKGIPLVAATAVALADVYGRDVPYCFNRKEAKKHGEGGTLVGAPMAGRVLVIDDVITAGTAIREALALIQGADAECTGVVVGLDRKEQGKDGQSAIAELARDFGVVVNSIVDIFDIMTYLEQLPDGENIRYAVSNYQTRYGIRESDQ